MTTSLRGLWFIVAAYWMAAIAELNLLKAPIKDGPRGQTRALWIETAEKLRDASIDFAYAAGMRDVNQMREVAPRIPPLCNSCHAKFKE